MTTFAKGLASGTIQAPPKTSWWPRHTRTMLRYLTLSGTKTPNAKIEIQGNMQKVAWEWEALIPKVARQGLMIEHATLEISLVDAVRLNNEADIDSIGKKLLENASQLSAVLGIAIKEFPEEHFRRLFMDHVGLYAGSVRKKIEGIVVNSAELESNMLQLADFTAEWL
jgi:hypothetical protein